MIEAVRRLPSSVVLVLIVALVLLGTVRAHAAGIPRSAARPVQVDISKLPIDIARIQRVLQAQQAAETERRQNPFRLEYYVQVYGKAPELDLLATFDTRNGPVPYSAPTHQEFLNLVTPQEFRAMQYGGGINLQQLIDWLSKQFAKKRDSGKP